MNKYKYIKFLNKFRRESRLSKHRVVISRFFDHAIPIEPTHLDQIHTNNKYLHPIIGGMIHFKRIVSITNKCTQDIYEYMVEERQSGKINNKSSKKFERTDELISYLKSSDCRYCKEQLTCIETSISQQKKKASKRKKRTKSKNMDGKKSTSEPKLVIQQEQMTLEEEKTKTGQVVPSELSQKTKRNEICNNNEMSHINGLKNCKINGFNSSSISGKNLPRANMIPTLFEIKRQQKQKLNQKIETEALINDSDLNKAIKSLPYLKITEKICNEPTANSLLSLAHNHMMRNVLGFFNVKLSGELEGYEIFNCQKTTNWVIFYLSYIRFKMDQNITKQPCDENQLKLYDKFDNEIAGKIVMYKNKIDGGNFSEIYFVFEQKKGLKDFYTKANYPTYERF